MNICIIGATGGTGLAIVRKAVTDGHKVTVLVRRPEALPHIEDVRIVPGDARDRGAIESVAPGQDAFICSLGIPAAGTTRTEIDDGEVATVCEVSTRLLFDAMPRYGVKRIVLMSTHGAGGSNDGSPYVKWLRDLVKNRVTDKDNMEAFIAASEADIAWTVIRNPRIYEGPSRPYDVYEKIELNRSSQITYGDLAAFALSEVVAPQHVGQFLTITEAQDDPGLMAAAQVARKITTWR